MVLYPYSFQAAFDPNTATTAPRDSVGQVFAVGDRTFSNPLPTVDLNGLPVTLTVGEFGYLPDFMVEDHTAVVWRSGEYVFQFATTIPVKGDEGEIGKSAYQSAVEQGFEGTEEEWLESLKGANVLPTDEAIAAALTDGGLAQAATKALADASAQAEVAPVAEQVGHLSQTVGQSATQSTRAANRAFTVTQKAAGGGIPAHTIIRVSNAIGAGLVVNKVTANDSLGTNPPRETIASFYKRTQASVIVNGSGSWDTNRYMGLTIINGQLIQGWEADPTWDLGNESAIFMKDGTLRVYDRNTAPEQIIADGGYNSFTWTQALYKNGALTGIQTAERYTQITGRQLVGDTLKGDLLIVSFPGKSDGSFGATAQHVIDALAGYAINNLYFMDGGGSVQTMVNGKYVVKSSDAGGERSVADALYLYAPDSTPSGDVDWTDLPLAAGIVVNGIVPQYKIKDRVGYFRGSIKPASGNFAAGSTTILSGIIPGFSNVGVDSVRTAWGPGTGGPVRMWIENSQLRITPPAGAVVGYINPAAMNGSPLD